MNLQDIVYPIYKIGYNSTVYKDDLGRTLVKNVYGVYILDNKNLLGSTLAARRRKINEPNIFKLKGTIFDLAQLIKNSGNCWYVDAEGNTFIYNKTRYYNIIYREIVERHIIEGKGTLLKLKGIDQSLLVSNKLAIHNEYAGIILYNGGYILYELTTIKKKDTRKML